MSCSCKIGGGPDGVCFECKSRRAFHARLAKLEEAKASEDYARGVADERARVVAWLRAKGWQVGKQQRVVMFTVADRIEGGKHEEKP